MVSVSVFITTIISLCICFVLPLGYLVALERKRTNVLRPYWLGALSFFLAQVIIRLPLLNILRTSTDWYAGLRDGNVWVYAMFVAVTTAVFEGLVRYLFVLFALKDRNRFIDAVSMGVGHGLIESVLFTGVTLLGMFFYFICINTNTLADMTGLTGAALEELEKQCLAMTGVDMIFLGIERLSSMAMQVGYTVMIYKSVKSRNPLLGLIAVLWQMIPNMLVVLLPEYGLADWVIQLAYVILGILGIAYVWMEKNSPVWKLTNDKNVGSLNAVTRRNF